MTSEQSTTPDLLELARRAIEADTYDEWAVLAERLDAPDAVWNLGGMLGSLEGLGAIRAFGQARAAAERVAEERV